ncbi:putative reverse transcriptase domain-containing protein [Tanacetum coccineum]
MDLMNRVCKLYLDKFGIVFIDDILIYSKSKEDHELEEVLFLGHVINNNDIHVDSSKIKAIKNWKVPKTPSEIRSFLGLAVYCDTSNQELGYVLMQRGKTWRHYLYGTKVVIYTDHKSFQHIFVQKELNMRQRRWIELFSDYDCEICYHPRKANIVADAFNKILTAQGEASKVGNATAEMLRGLDQQIEKKEDGGLYFIGRGWDSIDRYALVAMYKERYVAKALGTRLYMSTAYHPQTDGQSEQTIQTLEDMLRACGIDFGSSWDTHLPLAESPVLWAEIGESRLIGPELVQETTDKGGIEI